MNNRSFLPSTIIIFILFALVSADAQRDTVSFSAVMNENIVGFYKEWQLESNAWAGQYQINDRGRGDSLEIYYRENENAILTELLITGKDYYKAPVEESFTWNGTKATWKNSAENKTIQTTDPAFYMALDGSGGNLLRAFIKNNNKLKFLPSGDATLKILSHHEFEFEGNPIKLALYEIKGLGLTPSYGWMDEDQKSFANVGNWYSTILENYESLIPELLAIQNEVENKFFLDIAKKNVIDPKKILIKNVDLIDVEEKVIKRSYNVLIEDDLIKKVTPTDITMTGDHYTIDGNGLMLMPGLIDMHVHISDPQSAMQHIANGVTSVRDLGNSFAILDLRDQINNDEIIGPEIERISGLLDGRGEFAGPTPALAGDLEEALSWVDSFSTRGFDQIKIYSSIKPEWVPEIVQRAKSQGMRVSGHIPAYMNAEQAITMGYDEIQHMNMIFLNFFGDTIDTRTPLRFSIPGERAAGLDLESRMVEDFISLLKEKEIVVDATLHAFEGLLTSRKGILDEAYEPIIERVPINLQRYLQAGGGGLPTSPETDELYVASFKAFLNMTKLLYDKGVKIVAGTDAWAGFAMHREMELYVEAGIDEFDVLQLATIGAAEVLDKENVTATIAPGTKANVILVDGDPTKNISDIRNIKTVIKNGRIYDAVELLKAISIKSYDHKDK